MRFPFLSALSQRDFAKLWAGQTVSLIGDGIFTVALAWQALQLPSPTAALGIVLVVRSVMRVATLLVAGALADRYQKRLLMLGADTLQLVAIAALAYVVAGRHLEVWHLATVAGATGIGSGVFLASSSALVPELVTEEHFQSANSLRSSSDLFAYELVGPAIGGVLVAAVGTAAAFAVDAATFLASILALISVRPRGILDEEPSTTLLSDVKEGIGYVLRTPWIWISLIAVGMVGNFASFGPLAVLIPLFVRDHLHGNAAVLGFVWAGFGVGGLLGAIFTGSIRIRLSSAVPAYVGWGMSAVALGVLAFAPNALVAAVILGVAGFGGQIGEVIWDTLLQKLVPRRLLARVNSTDWLVSLTLQPVGLALAAPVAGWIGVAGALILGAGLSSSAMAAGAASRAVRNLPPR
ncbi:MAG: MFS transporter [Actinobacteria bacterium]|nr:MFS transporter [Actinomycetota bacterium]